jgi:ubiquinone/menaquinone biosynthesis C-methylase UbiE
MKNQEAINYLRKLSSSPYSPEMPQQHLIVNFFMMIAKLFHCGSRIAPHLFRGDDVSKVIYEYNNAHLFFDILTRNLGLDILNNKEALDVGCGWGSKTIYYAEYSRCKTIHGFDVPNIYNPEISLKFASSKGLPNCFFKTGYAEAMPYKGNSFDIILMEDVMEHVQDPKKVIQECYRVLRSEGKLIIKFPSFKGIYSHHLDRAINLPALHYILPMKIWAQGLNYLLFDPSYKLFYEPFDEIIFTPYCKSITHNLNGLDFRQFKKIIEKTDFKTIKIELIPFQINRYTHLIKSFYNLFWRLKNLQEFLSSFVLFIGEKNSINMNNENVI